ncbi:MAG: hypothetical protein ACI4QJ_08630 [Candidatus Spyradenecus sp.]
MSPFKFFLFLLLLCALFLCTYVYFVFHPFPFTYTSQEKAFLALKEANVPDDDIAKLFGASPLRQEVIKRCFALNDENVYRLLAQNPSLSRADFLCLWEKSLVYTNGRHIRLSIIACQPLTPLEVEHLLSEEFDYSLWSALVQNPVLTDEQFSKLLSLTPDEFKQSISDLRKFSLRSRRTM